MLSKKQVFEAALKYAQDQNHGKNKAAIEPDCDFIAGAMWAADELASILEANTLTPIPTLYMSAKSKSPKSEENSGKHLPMQPSFRAGPTAQVVISGYQKMLSAKKVDQFDQYRDEVAKAVQGLRAKNELLTEALLWAIADLETMHDSAGTPPGERHLIEKLKKAME